jgi:hypothetical protein
LLRRSRRWTRDSDLASVRDRGGDLPDGRDAWQGLWAAVDGAMATVRRLRRLVDPDGDFMP